MVSPSRRKGDSSVYVLYKLLQVLLWPEIWIFACFVGAWVAFYSTRRHALGRWLLFVGILLFYIVGITPTGDALLRPLELRYVPLRGGEGHAYDAVVVLSGGIKRQPQTGATTILGTHSLDRLVCGMRLVRNGAAPILVLSGAGGHPFDFLPCSDGFARVNAAIHEYVGIAASRAMGYL